ncbi:GntR family transcriptional regulator [Nocardiopsis sp. SBT366]|uniref:GntR family transcriptional regulator n=1 Tax=Nocardiopsis sp. SBT366 TaxID=1580529 RepID=UPI00066EE67F|nr:GntR family transcriptional regulator [Nocardiopsis sp. SBT366]
MTSEERGERPPPSRRIADQLRAAIQDGDLRPGGRLPSERELAEAHGTARNTAREAIRILAEEGLVDRRHGSGVFVRERRRALRFGAERYSRRLREKTGLSPYRAELAKQGLLPRVDCVSIQRVVAPTEIAERLRLPVGTPDVVRRENWYYASDGASEHPVQVGVTYVPWPIAEGTPLADSANLGKGSLYARFEERGHRITRSREEVTARMPSHEEARGLNLPTGVPVLEVLHTGIDQAGHPFEVTRFVMRADLAALDYDMAVEETDD